MSNREATVCYLYKNANGYWANCKALGTWGTHQSLSQLKQEVRDAAKRSGLSIGFKPVKTVK